MLAKARVSLIMVVKIDDLVRNFCYFNELLTFLMGMWLLSIIVVLQSSLYSHDLFPALPPR